MTPIPQAGLTARTCEPPHFPEYQRQAERSDVRYGDERMAPPEGTRTTESKAQPIRRPLPGAGSGHESPL